MFDLNKKNILITGATGYLGQEMAFALCSRGAKVFVNSRDYNKANNLVNILNKKGYLAEEAIFDVTNAASIDLWLENVELNTLHGVINNAYAGSAGSIETSTEDDFRNSFDITVVAAQRLFKKLLPLFRLTREKNEQVSILNISSMYGSVSPNLNVYKNKKVSNPPFYGASKAALHQWSKYGACEFSSEGIRFNTLSPGPFPNLNVQKESPDFVKILNEKVPMGRIGQAIEIRGPVVFLMSDDSSYVNGTNLEVNGGWTCW